MTSYRRETQRNIVTRRLLAALLLPILFVACPAWAEEAGKPAPAAYVVVVDYTADAQNFAALKSLIEAVAQASMGEPGCRRFDIVQPAASPNHLLLYEIFDDAAAFQAHAATPHFKQFAIDSAKLNATRTATPGTMLVSMQKP
jgi:(4S)-4-hydroxy-5-phosphonooxypentane-2,3-dione isomerase